MSHFYIHIVSILNYTLTHGDVFHHIMDRPPFAFNFSHRRETFVSPYRILVCSLSFIAATVPAHAFADTDLFCSGLVTKVSANQSLSTVSDTGNAELRLHLTDTTVTATLPTLMSDTAALTIKNVVYTDTAITAEGPMIVFGARPSLSIDRTTGYIRLVTQFAGEFTGTCRKYDPTAVTKLF